MKKEQFNALVKSYVSVPKPFKPKWIKVSKKIPSLDQNILAYNGKFKFIVIFDGFDITTNDFTHWMPISDELLEWLGMKLTS